MSIQTIQTKIFELRNHKVMLDFDLATLYEVETRVLNQAVKRNIKRFPRDFMFQLTRLEWTTLISQFVISKNGKRGGTQKLLFAFTEQGLAMLSGILNSDKAIKVNINIMRTFVVLRQFALTNENLTKKLKEIETKYDKQFNDINEAINFLMQGARHQSIQNTRKRIGYKK